MTGAIVRNLMTEDPLKVRASTLLSEAIAVLALAEVRHLPVVDEAGVLTGMLSERDALAVLSFEKTSTDADREQARALTVDDVMAKDVFTCTSATPVTELCDIFLTHKVGAVPVCDEGKLVGIASYIDVLRAARSLFAAPTD